MSDTKARPIVIDTDPGIDDAIGILLALASPELDVRGMTTVAGNIGIETTARNAARLLAFAGLSDIPVLIGAQQPLSRPGPEPLGLHGADGVGGVDLPEPLRSPAERSAVDWLADLLLGEDPGTVEVLALGPLTNVAELVVKRPEVAQRIGRIIAMGGAIHEPGNVGPRAEFNIATDPEAADIVFRSGVPVVLVPLDVTRRVRATRNFAERLAASLVPGAVKTAELIEAYFLSAAERESRPLHDPCVMLLALRPDLFECETLRLTVGTGSEEAGALLVDEGQGAPVQVAMRVDAPAALDLLEKGLTGVRGHGPA
ncbi:nucleoside hydrolase [Microvirga subterranea]|uniref:Purine nucleosidase/pyrimidine-specific ribonucleoside hydrolase n=1 Tax=Microvirga subterranea TaxID=186651 RepID=A0A370HPN1_9HYPH|nr:nucleoside hydrolase [Microvirga subterranea]RDI58854.1 purine nucleosidase/pyrimidine-specific ribonucleoside hydrolase [Microvirga subterranea]